MENKYLAILKARARNPVLGTSEGLTADNKAVNSSADSFPIVSEEPSQFDGVRRQPSLLMKPYKKAKLSKAKSGWFVWFEYVNPITGEFEQHTRKCGINRIKNLRERKVEAEELINAINELLQEGWSPHGYATETNEFHQKTLLECLRLVLKLKGSLRPRSMDAYKDTVRVFEEWITVAGVKYFFPEMFKPIHALQFGDYMTVQKKYSGKTFNNHRENMCGFFNVIMDRVDIYKNPFRKIPKQPENSQKNLAFTKEERSKLRKYFIEHDPLLGQFCQSIYFLGIRPEELLQVQLRDVYIEDRKIMIYTGSAKNRRQEPVYMSEAMVEMITAKNIQDYPSDWYLFGHKLEISAKRWIRNRVSERHLFVRQKLSLHPDHTLYSWKHTGAIEFYMHNGKDPYKLMKHLRHTEIDTTMKYLRSLGMDYNASIQVPAF